VAQILDSVVSNDDVQPSNVVSLNVEHQSIFFYFSVTFLTGKEKMGDVYLDRTHTCSLVRGWVSVVLVWTQKFPKECLPLGGDGHVKYNNILLYHTRISVGLFWLISVWYLFGWLVVLFPIWIRFRLLCGP
jgi:hypothetical protein